MYIISCTEDHCLCSTPHATPIQTTPILISLSHKFLRYQPYYYLGPTRYTFPPHFLFPISLSFESPPFKSPTSPCICYSERRDADEDGEQRDHQRQGRKEVRDRSQGAEMVDTASGDWLLKMDVCAGEAHLHGDERGEREM